MPISVSYNDTFFNFSAQITLLELLHNLRVRKDQFPTLVRFDPRRSQSDVDSSTESDTTYDELNVVTDPYEPIPDGVYTLVTGSISEGLQHGLKRTDNTGGTNDPKFLAWYRKYFGREFASVKHYKRYSPRCDHNAGGDGETEVSAENGHNGSTESDASRSQRSPAGSCRGDHMSQNSESDRGERLTDAETVSVSSGTNTLSDGAGNNAPAVRERHPRRGSRRRHGSADSGSGSSSSIASIDSDMARAHGRTMSRGASECRRESFAPHSGGHRSPRSQLSDDFLEAADMDAGIKAMAAAIASIPQRYYKYNAVLSAKMDIALTRIDGIREELKKTSDAKRQRMLHSQILAILHAVWRTAWAKYSPKMRKYPGTEYSIRDTMHAEDSLNNLNMWRRIMESSELPRNDKDAEKSLRLLNGPTHLFRKNPFNPPYIYVASFLPQRDVLAEKSLDELIREVRLLFLQSAVRDQVYKDRDLNNLLLEIVESRRILELDSDAHGSAAWAFVTAKLRREFWLDGRPRTARDFAEKEAEESSDGSVYSDDPRPQKPKKGVRWNKDSYY
ncbi:hypothetical protein HDU84_003263 [Entophlyctis sp. JEL0112]|nr:hypothetical protein HDU84_003263 [Entophlyctis sp. JEL0112]